MMRFSLIAVFLLVAASVVFSDETRAGGRRKQGNDLINLFAIVVPCELKVALEVLVKSVLGHPNTTLKPIEEGHLALTYCALEAEIDAVCAPYDKVVHLPDCMREGTEDEEKHTPNPMVITLANCIERNIAKYANTSDLSVDIWKDRR